MIARRSGVRIVSSLLIAASLAGVGFVFRDPMREAWREELLRRATEPTDTLTPRVVTSPRTGTLLAASMAGLPGRRTSRAAVAALLRGNDDGGVQDIHRTGVAFLLLGKPQDAAAKLRMAAAREQNPAWWSDLAAAEIYVGDATDDPERYLAALVAADQALALDARLPEAHFNRAIVMERLGFERASIAQWQKALELERSSTWASAVAVHIAGLSKKKTARERWSEAQQRIEAGHMPPNLDRLIDDHPQDARTWAESWFLPLWGKQYLSGQRGDLFLDVTRAIGNRIASRSGERLLQQAVATVDAATASGDNGRLEMLARGVSAYFDGRVSFRKGELDAAAREFEKARVAFAACGSSMLEVAELYLAMSAILENRGAEARVSLVGLLERAQEAGGHESLAAYAEQYIALIDALDGRWGDALAIATSSRDRFARLGERENAAEAELTMAHALAALGRPQLAWKHYLRTTAEFSSGGRLDRLQVCAAAMNYVEMRRQRWSSARALSRIELALGSGPEAVAHAHLRAGVAAFGMGDFAAAQSSAREARRTAMWTKDETRERLMADIVAVEGRLLAASDPATAVSRFTESIAFQRRAGRAFTLPELYLERGRAELARGGREAALADFDQGIELLEHERSRVRDHELRDGLFDNARDLFAEAVAVSLDRGDSRAAFEYLERGRARALLEELGEVELPQRASIAAVQRSLGPGMLMLAYALLGERVAIFAIDSGGIDVRFSEVRAEALTEQVRELAVALEKERDISGPAGNIHDALLLPVRDLLSRSTTLVFIPDGALAQLPFSALFDRRANSYLVDSHESLLAPSAAVFVACRRRAGEVEAVAPRSIAMFANPAIPADLQLPSLPAAGSEAARVAGRYPKSLVLRGAEATAARFRHDAPRYDVVQFSGHARIDTAEPWKSALLLDEPLTAREIATMHFPHTRLAILGACSTLASNDDRVEGTAPIAASFLMAGVPAVVGSLWDVDDAEAAAVMVRLHEHISRGVPASTALRAVQRELLHSGSRHPAAWAAFTVLGADRR